MRPVTEDSSVWEVRFPDTGTERWPLAQLRSNIVSVVGMREVRALITAAPYRSPDPHDPPPPGPGIDTAAVVSDVRKRYPQAAMRVLAPDPAAIKKKKGKVN